MTRRLIVSYVAITVLWARERSMRRFAQLSMVAGLVTNDVAGLAPDRS